MTKQSLADLVEECRSLMHTARETASRLEFLADALAARAAEFEADVPHSGQPRRPEDSDDSN